MNARVAIVRRARHTHEDKIMIIEHDNNVHILIVVEHNDDDTLTFRVPFIDDDIIEIELRACEYHCNETIVLSCEDDVATIAQVVKHAIATRRATIDA
jgi:aspartokinase